MESASFVVNLCLNCGSDDHEAWAWAEDVEYETSAERWEYRRCRACGVIFLPDPPIDRLSEIYPPNYYSYVGEGGSFVDRVKNRLDKRLIAELCSRVAGESLHLLDVGGGTGYLASVARAADGRVRESTVVDLDERCRPRAEANGHRFVCSRIEDLAVDDRYDVVLAVNLIEHVFDPRAVLDVFRNLLRPGGRVLIKTPNHDALDARLFRHRSWGGYHCPRHWVLFDAPSMREAAEVSGFTVERLAFTQGAPFWSVSVLHELERLGVLRRRAGEAITEHALFGPVAACAAAFDLARQPVAKTSQMLVTLTPASPR